MQCIYLLGKCWVLDRSQRKNQQFISGWEQPKVTWCLLNVLSLLSKVRCLAVGHLHRSVHLLATSSQNSCDLVQHCFLVTLSIFWFGGIFYMRTSIGVHSSFCILYFSHQVLSPGVSGGRHHTLPFLFFCISCHLPFPSSPQSLALSLLALSLTLGGSSVSRPPGHLTNFLHGIQLTSSIYWKYSNHHSLFKQDFCSFNFQNYILGFPLTICVVSNCLNNPKYNSDIDFQRNGEKMNFDLPC